MEAKIVTSLPRICENNHSKFEIKLEAIFKRVDKSKIKFNEFRGQIDD